MSRCVDQPIFRPPSRFHQIAQPESCSLNILACVAPARRPPQVEGFVIDRNLSLGHLMGTIADFYRRLGPEFNDLKFKPVRALHHPPRAGGRETRPRRARRERPLNS